MSRTTKERASVAAVVYDEGVAVDLLLAVFAQQLQQQGARIGGVIHAHLNEEHCSPAQPLHLQNVATGRVFQLCSRAPETHKGCAMNLDVLAEAGRVAELAIAERVELLFVSRFGKLEQRGQGFASIVRRARLARVPVLTAVKRKFADAWLEHNEGHALLLEPRLWLLSAWWQELARPAPSTTRPRTMHCSQLGEPTYG